MKMFRPFALVLGLIFLAGIVASAQAPIANDDDNFGWEAEVLTGNLSLNDNNPGGGPLTYSVVTGPPSGSFTLQPNGNYSYTPLPEFNGFIYITVQACNSQGLCDQSILELAFLFVNDPPVIVNDVFFVNVNSVLTGNVTANDSDIDIEPIFATVLNPPSVGTLTMGMFGNFTYTPPANFIGAVTFTYRGCDPCEVCGQATVTINVTPPNNPPIVNDDDTFTSEGGFVTGTVAMNDSDPEGMPLAFSLLDGPDNGEILFNANGTYTYTPDDYYYGFDVVTYQACDPFNACTQGILIIEVIFVNDVPVILDDAYSGAEDQPIMGNVAANDFEYDDEFIFYSVFTQPSSGTLSMFNDGFFTYTPAPNFSGAVTAVYFGVDPCGVGDFGTITFTITPVNDAPVAVADNAIMQEDGVLNGSVATNDFDVDHSSRTFNVITNPSSGSLQFNNNGTYTYTPVANFAGTVSFIYQVCDPLGLCSQTTCTIQVQGVNDIPVAMDDSFTTNEDVAVTGSVATNDIDIDSPELLYILQQGPAEGNLEFNPDGTFTYTPALDDSGVYTATYEVSDDQGGADIATITFIIVGVNDALEANNDQFGMQEDAVLNGNLSTNDNDPDGDPLTYTVLVGPTSGALVVNLNGTFTYTPGLNYFGTQTMSIQVCDAPNSCEISSLIIVVSPVNDTPVSVNDSFSGNEDQNISGSVATNDSDVDSSNLTYGIVTGVSSGIFNMTSAGVFTFAPSLNYNGTQTVTYQVCDNGSLCAQATLTLVVNPINDAPFAGNDNATIQEEGTLNGTVTANDGDVDGGLLTYTITTPPASGTFVMQANGSYTYTPAVNFFGNVSAQYSVCDAAGLCANATLTITVTNVNDAPLANNDTFTVIEDGVLGGNVSLNDSDPDGGTLTYSLVGNTQNGTISMNANGVFNYTPFANFHGVEQVNYQVCDAQGLCDQGNIFITVVPVNDAPVAVNDVLGILVNTSGSGNVATNDIDVDHPALIYSIVTGPSNGTIEMNQNGIYTYTPNEFFSGQEVIIYSVCDGLNVCDQGTLTISIINNNVAPVAVHDVFNTLEDSPITVSVANNDTDANNQILTYSLILWPSNGNLSFATNGQFTYSPSLNFYGNDSFTYQVCDPFGECDQAIVTISIMEVNDNPIIQNDAFVLNEDQTLQANAAANDLEPDGSLLLYSVVFEPMHGELTLFNDGFFGYVPFDNYNGTDSFVYRACDPCGVCVQGTVTLTITPANDAPAALGESASIYNNELLEGNVSLNDFDIEGDQLTYTIIAFPVSGAIGMSENGGYSYEPEADWSGVVEIVYEVCDVFGACDQATLTIEVIAPNTPPTSSDASFSTCAGEAVLIDIASLIADAEEDVMSLNVTEALVTEGLIELDNANKVITFLPNEVVNGVCEINYTICDNGTPQGCSSSLITVTVVHSEGPQIVSETINDVQCFGDNNGSISIEAVGQGTLSYSWNNESNGTALVGLEPGEYEVTITDEAVCGEPTLATFVVEGPSAALTLGEIVSNSIDIDAGGLSLSEVIGGTAPYSYEWYNANGELVSTESDLTGLLTEEQAGSYSVVVMDANGCEATSSGVVLNTVELSSNIEWSVYPNPAREVLNVEVAMSGKKNFVLYDMNGRIVQEIISSDQRLTFNLSNLAAGDYVLRVFDGNDLSQIEKVIKLK
ncbi:MAG: Ig-like domain-containing protein [Flavobacteriales bacterium]|jgi:VCBS repeat-containing protein